MRGSVSMTSKERAVVDIDVQEMMLYPECLTVKIHQSHLAAQKS